jgi:hypothetical protein
MKTPAMRPTPSWRGASQPLRHGRNCIAFIHHIQNDGVLLPAYIVPSGYSNNVSTRCACTIASHSDHAKIVKRPSCEATRARVSR